MDGIWWDTGLRGESGEPPQHHQEHELLHNKCPEEGAPKAEPDTSAGQSSVTERAPELAGDRNATVRAVVIHLTSRHDLVGRELQGIQSPNRSGWAQECPVGPEARRQLSAGYYRGPRL
jgi:hypothetical protein